MSDDKVIYLSDVLKSKSGIDDALPHDSLELISRFMDIQSPENRQAVIDFCVKIATAENMRKD